MLQVYHKRFMGAYKIAIFQQFFIFMNGFTGTYSCPVGKMKVGIIAAGFAINNIFYFNYLKTFYRWKTKAGSLKKRWHIIFLL
jgi:hypothetical protein